MSSGFISEAELQKQREQRQQEWERVRTADQPTEAPEAPQEPFDARCLYDKLQDAKNKKQEEWDESRKFKNTIKNLDEDECSFLELVDKSKMELSKRIEERDKEELIQFRQAQLSVDESILTAAVQSVVSESAPRGRTASAAGARSCQSQLLRGAVRKRSACPADTAVCDKRQRLDPPPASSLDNGEASAAETTLPGIGCYSSSSDSDGDDANT